MSTKDYREGFHSAKAVLIQAVVGWLESQPSLRPMITERPIKDIIEIMESVKLKEVEQSKRKKS